MTVVKTFIIGAGCSLDFGMPTGEGIIETILLKLQSESAYKLNSDLFGLGLVEPNVVNQAVFQSEVYPKYKDLQNKIYYSGVTSIDTFLSQYKDNDFESNVIKYILCNEIKRLEGASLEKQYLKKSDDRREGELFKFKNNYLRLIFKKIFTQGSIDVLRLHLMENKYRFVIFNYDRCVEYFLGKAIQNYYNISDDELLEIFKSIDIKHVYGTLNSEKMTIIEILKDFETDYKVKDINNIKTIRYENNDLSSIGNQKIANSDKIVMLGLAYNEINFQIFPNNRYVYGEKFILTTLGMSDGDLNKVERRLFGGIGSLDMINRRNWSAFELINHHL